MMVSALPGRRFRLWFQDEARLGTRPRRKRRLTARGTKALAVGAIEYEWTWLYGMVEPLSGESFLMEWPVLDSPCFGHFLEAFRRQFHEPGVVHLVVCDRAGAHRGELSGWGDGVVPVFLPAYCPEYNPVERLWQEMRRQMQAWHPKMSSLREDMDAWVNGLTTDFIHSVCCFPYLEATYHEL